MQSFSNLYVGDDTGKDAGSRFEIIDSDHAWKKSDSSEDLLGSSAARLLSPYSLCCLLPNFLLLHLVLFLTGRPHLGESIGTLFIALEEVVVILPHAKEMEAPTVSTPSVVLAGPTKPVLGFLLERVPLPTLLSFT